MLDPSFDSLPSPVVLEDTLRSLPIGVRTSLVATVEKWGESGKHWCRSKIFRQEFLLCANIPQEAFTISILGGIVSRSHLGTEIQVLDPQNVLIIPPLTDEAFYRVVETCSGIGAMGQGASYAHFKVAVQNEIQSSFEGILKSASDAAVIIGDNGLLSTVRSVWNANPKPSTLACGFSCQPYSQAGDRKQGMDCRALSLPHALFMGWMIQSPIIVLECVTEVMNSAWAKKTLHEFCNHTRFAYSDTMLQLEDLWPGKRNRWWGVLAHGRVGKVPFSPFPKVHFQPSICDLIPSFLKLPEQWLKQILLSPAEIRSFNKFSKGVETLQADFFAPLPTALHSWGAQVTKCPCGCRAAFSDERLSKRGIFGVLIQEEDDNGDVLYRHVSPQEVALLCGFPRTHSWDHDARLLLCGIGQLASPMHAAWIFSHVHVHLRSAGIHHKPTIRPCSVLAQVCNDLFALRDAWFGKYSTASMQQFKKAVYQALQSEASESNCLAMCDFRPEEVESWPCKDPQCPLGHEEEAEDVPPLPKKAKKDSASIDRTKIHLQVCSPTLPWSLQDESDHSQASREHAQLQSIGAVPGFACTTVLNGDPEKVSSWATGPLRIDSHVDVLHASVPQPVAEIKPKEPEDRKKVVPVELASPSHQSDQTEADCLSPRSFEEVFPKILLPSHQGSHAGCFGSNPVLVVNCCDWSVQAVQFNAGQTYSDLVEAEIKLTGNKAGLSVSSAIGMQICPEKLLHHQSVVVFKLPALPDEVMASRNEVSDKLQSLPRVIGLFEQGPFVAVDEASYYMQIAASTYGAIPADPLIVDSLNAGPLVAEAWFRNIVDVAAIERKHAGASDVQVLSAILANGHWHPVHVRVGIDRKIKVSLSLGGEYLWKSLFSEAVRQAHTIKARPFETAFDNDCGFQLMPWWAHECTGEDFELVTLEQAERMRFWFAIKAMQTPGEVIPQTLLVGGANDLQVAAQAILKDHGVFPERLESRCDMVLERLGVHQVQSALQSTRPWAAIKALANQLQPRVQIILQDEFEQVKQQRAKDPKPVGSKSMKKSQLKKLPEVVLGSTDIFVPEGVFKQQDGKYVSQIRLQDIGPHAKGIVLGSETELAPYLQRTQLSSQGLLLAIINPSPSCIQTFGEATRFPAACVSTQEPMIIAAVLVQKGQLAVSRNLPESPPTIQEEANSVFKLLVFRDEIPTPWNEFCKAPLRWIVEQMPLLQVCSLDNCSCPKRHSKQETNADVLLDVWGRNFVTLRFNKSSAELAEMFSCHIRVAEHTVSALFKCSGVGGLYLEPRAVNGKRDDEGYHTVWLQQKTLAEVKADMASVEGRAAIIRIGHKYGIRVPQANAAEVHSKLRGDAPFLFGAAKTTWHVSPLPWGTTRRSLQDILDHWGWRARPLQSTGRSADGTGLSWLVQAAEKPRNTVYTLKHGDIVITLASDENHVPKEQSLQIEVGKRTRAALSGAIDPWTVGKDPWASAQAQPHSSSGKAVEGALTMKHLQTFEASLDAKIASKLAEVAKQTNDVPMDGQLNERVAALEQQMSQVSQQQQAQAHASSALTSQIGALAQQFEAHTQSIEGSIDAKLGFHMKRLEELLQKRPRQE